MGRVAGRIARAFGRTESSQSRKAGKFGVVGALVTGLLATSLVTGSQLGSAAPLDSTVQTGQRFQLNDGDLRFILKQIKIAEAHAAVSPTPSGEALVGNSLTGPGKYQIGNPLLPYGLRTVDGSYNNLVPGQEKFGSTGHILNRHTTAVAREADAPWDTMSPAGILGGPTNDGSPLVNTNYGQKLTGNVVIDREPREVSNLIVDQTPSNPAAVAAARTPVRTSFNDATAWPCATLGSAPAGSFGPYGVVEIPDLVDCTPNGETLDIPNVTTDFGLSPGYNSWFTIFGQFFDHGLDLTAKAGGTVYVPLNADDPLIAGPDMIPGNTDDPQVGAPNWVPYSLRFMAITRAENQAGPDGKVNDDPATPQNESADNPINTSNGDSSWVDQSQTYTSIPSHQVFLREYQMSGGRPIATGKLIENAGGMATWTDVRAQAATKLGIRLEDADIHSIPLLKTDPYGRFLRSVTGFPIMIVTNLDGTNLRDMPVSLAGGGTPTTDGVTYKAVSSNLPFLNDIAHHAAPGMSDCHGVDGADELRKPDLNPGVSDDGDCRTYDDEMLGAHFMAGDPRVNENIALTAAHQIFHSEHNRLVAEIAGQIASQIPPQDKAAWNNTSTHWLTQLTYPAGGGVVETTLPGWLPSRAGIYEERLFQAARFVTEMEYQHLVFEEFARKVQPGISPFNVFTQSSTGIDPAITAEFAHAVYRFGHSMLTDTVARTAPNGTTYDASLLSVFLNPPAYRDGPDADLTGNDLSPADAAGAIITGLTDQTGQELDEFVADTLRNNLLGLPLDLATLNMARARDAGIPPLNVLRRELAHLDGSLAPYVSWKDFGLNLKHPESLVNFIAAYGTHPSIVDPDSNPATETSLAEKRAAAQLLVTNDDPFLTSPAATSGLDTVDLWIGGLAEITNIGGGLLGTTFNYIFEKQLTDLQDGDRLYYLSRTSGMNLRTQLEGNSFAELIMRNTNAVGLKADLFATADCQFSMAYAQNPTHQAGTSIIDDPATTDCDENARLTVVGNTIAYRTTNTEEPAGLNAQTTYNGTPGVDRIRGGVDTDTFWGGAGGDIIEGNDGADFFQTGDGDDIITDIHGPDFIRSGNGNDSVDAGPDNDVIMTGYGDDFVNGGLNSNQVFASEGDDLVIAGNGADTVFGSGGDDWLEGGNSNDLLQGDSGAPFFDDINCTYDDSLPVQRCVGGHDVFIGGNGENDYDAEGGDDIMFASASIERSAGLTGFDWVTHKGSAINGYSDLTIHVNFAPGALADRFLMTESASGWIRDDELLGDQWTTLEQDVELHGPWGSNALTTAGINRIAGLRDLLAQHDRGASPDLNHDGLGDGPDACYTDPQLFGDEGEGGPPQPVAVTICGYVKGAIPPAAGAPPAGGNILIGGAGSDSIRGRGADDVIDGDLWLDVQLRATDREGDVVDVDSLSQIQDRLMSEPTTTDHINPGNVNIVRSIKLGVGGTDTAMYGGAYADYDFWKDAAGVLRVSHVRNVPPPTDQALPGGDGTDTLTNIELLKFDNGTLPDQIVSVTSLPLASLSPNPLAFGNRPISSSVTLPVTVSNVGTGLPLDVLGAAVTGAGAAVYTAATTCTTVPAGGSCTVNVTYAPTGAGSFPATLTISTNNGAKDVALSGTAGAIPNAPVTPTLTAGDGQITVNWAAPNNNGSTISRYDVEVFNVTAGTLVGVFADPNTASPFIATGLTNGSQYRFRVRAANIVGDGPFSAPATATPLNTPPSVVSTSPLSGLPLANRSANITVTMSEAIAPASLVNNVRLVRLFPTTNIPVNASVSGGNQIVIDPIQTPLPNPFFLLAPYRVELDGGAGGITDLAGIPMAANFQLTFSIIGGTPASLTGFSALTPTRLADTRSGTTPTEAATGPVTPGNPLTLNVAGQAGVPAGAAAVSLNVTVANPAAAGWVKVYGCGEMPATSNVNFNADQTVANAVLTPVAANGNICIASQVPTDVVVDINGYFSADAGMTPVTPARLLDTRDSGTRVSAGVPLKLAVAGQGGVASGASAASLNVTVVNPSHAGWVKVHPCGTVQTTSNVNFTAHQIVANAVVTALSADGSVCITSQVDTDVVVDVNGYFTKDGAAPFTPSRLVDTRPGESPDAAVAVAKQQVTPGSPLRITVAGVAGVSAEDLGAVALNVTATNPTAAGWLNVYGCGAMPFASNVNFVAGQTVANSVLSPVSADGAICIASNVATDVVVDVNGYFHK